MRYRWEPAAGRAPVAFDLRIQLAEPDDPTHDPRSVWPDRREEFTAGWLEIAPPADDQDPWNTQAFNPTRVTTANQLSDDPVLAFHAHAYAESHLRRSEASRASPSAVNLPGAPAV
ncbi:hypothetical protein ACGFY9_47455 [Streptomyces sp. NPDC048504]|uniref:hypothetical protein n=1 Tax=Streptomyces sp. NPDC048504 TaxID=3365559 RepID=UPI003713F3F6